MKYCALCGESFNPVTAWQKFCSESCKRRFRWKQEREGRVWERHCRQCGSIINTRGRTNNNRWHCSEECAKKSARESRSKFYEKNPHKDKEYRSKSRERMGPDGNLKRFYSRYPDAPRACQSCGETRVLDIAHKPGHERNGAWRSNKNTTLEIVWILCPTCHALLDRMRYSPEELGLV